MNNKKSEEPRSFRYTSIKAYREIEAEGILTKTLWDVYRTLFHYGPMTATECFDKIDETNTGKVNRNTRTRFGELRDRGALIETGVRPCKNTGRTVIEWDVSDRIPGPPPTKPALISRAKLADQNIAYHDLLVSVAKWLETKDLSKASLRIYQRIDEIKNPSRSTPSKVVARSQPVSTREPHCCECAQQLISDENNKCSCCGWITCDSCGACGCGR